MSADDVEVRMDGEGDDAAAFASASTRQQDGGENKSLDANDDATRSDAARAAFGNRDAEASRQVHMEKLVEEGRRTHGAQEQHAGDDNNYVRSLVLGGLDGIVTTFAVVSAATGGNLSDRVLLLMGFANLVADGMSMGLGDFLSSKAEKDYTVKELDREIWEFENYPKGEIEEMVELYVRRGLEEGDARTIVTTMAKYKDSFVDMMMVEELGLLPPEHGIAPWKNGLVTFTAFVVFGAIPLGAQLALNKANMQKTTGFALTCVITLLSLAVLGGAKASYTGENKLLSALYMILNGGSAAAAAFLIGLGIGELGGGE